MVKIKAVRKFKTSKNKVNFLKTMIRVFKVKKKVWWETDKVSQG